ncbi:hypothetical protein ACEWY4_019666 [Coilia grayii]|uniref:Ig-like domain-containing protein n=1 Tax=Coilia grayii TaxID=363190 RepID=A0ABD1JAC5_9TELE
MKIRSCGVMYHESCVFLGLCICQNVLEPGPAIGAVGGNVWLKTNLSPPAKPIIVLMWSRNLENIITYVRGDNLTNYSAPEYRDRISLNTSTGSLELQNLTLNDAGVYYLDMVPSGSAGKHGNISLHVFEMISNASITPSPAIVIANESSLNLTCVAQGNISDIEWTKDGKNMSPHNRVSLHRNNRTLIISPVERIDDGLYECKLSNPVSTMTAVFTLAVNYGPLNVTISGPTEISASDNATFTCSADSHPPSEFSWAFSGGDRSVTGPVYKIRNSKVEDSGNYTCTASNPKTGSKVSVTHMLIVNGEITGAVISDPGDSLLAGVSSINLTCDAQGTIMTREWTKGGSPLSSSSTITFSEDNRTLAISQVKKEDRGEYICNISNPFHSLAARQNVTVNYGPDTVLIIGSETVDIGHIIHLTCTADSFPETSYTWAFNGRQIATGASYINKESAYDDSGRYTCSAHNSITLLSGKADINVSVTGKDQLRSLARHFSQNDCQQNTISPISNTIAMIL